MEITSRGRGLGPLARFMRPKQARVDAVASAVQTLVCCRAAVWAAVAGVLIASLFPGPGSAQEKGNFPTIAKSYGTSSISVGDSTTLTFVVAASVNGNTGINFTDTLPGGLVIATPNRLSVTGGDPSCAASNVTANSGGGSISLANVSLASSQTCTVVVDVT